MMKVVWKIVFGAVLMAVVSVALGTGIPGGWSDADVSSLEVIQASFPANFNYSSFN